MQTTTEPTIARRILNFFSKGTERTVKIKQSVFFSIIFKGGSILINFALVPLILGYLNPSRYGIWLTISSIVGMVSFFDLGLGNGLRNKFGEARAKGMDVLAKEYVSTTYAVIFFISLVLFLVFNVLYPFIDINKVLNSDAQLSSEIRQTVYIVFSFYCLQFVFGLIGTILTADQKPFLNTFFSFLYTLLSFVAVFILTKLTSGSLFYMGVAVSSMPVLVFFVSSIILYKTTYKKYAPDIRFIQFEHLKSIAGLGVLFFIIQSSHIIIFSTSNIIISHTLSPAEVTPYNIAFKYFSIVTMGYYIILTPFWSGFTDAYYRNDMAWIKRTMKKLNLLSLVVVLLLMTMVLVSEYFYRFWVGPEIKIPFTLSILMAIYVFITTCITPFVFFMNGTGKVKMQFYISIIAAMVNIPLSIFLTQTLGLGIKGIILSPILCMLPYLILMPLQYKKIISNSAEGIWNK